jgi:lipopolysaccharide assembly outer membrane protein LptD (OstA)
MKRYFFYILFLNALTTHSLIGYSQQTTTTVITPINNGDTSEINILGSNRLTLLKTDDTTTLQILAGHVKLKQGKTFFNCDSCILDKQHNLFEAWGNVHINDNDSINVFSGHLRYIIDQKLAYLDQNVKLSDGKGTLTTPDLEYNVKTNIGIYTHGGKVINKKTVLTSKEGYYYASLKDIYFKYNVVLNDPAYKIRTDSLLYSTATQITRFIAPTTIKDSSGRTIQTSDGYYNMAAGKAEFGQRPIIRDKNTLVIADKVAFNDSIGTSQAVGNVIIKDTAQGTTILAGEVFRDTKKDRFLAQNKPLMIIKQDKDSIYISATTIFSARLTDLPNKKDSITKKDSIIKDTVKGRKILKVEKTDSTNRYIEAYGNVRIFSDSMQAVSDSLFYSLKDSTYKLFKEPIVWSNGVQLTGDTIFLLTKNRKADKLRVFENSMLVSKLDPEMFNQVSANRMIGYFTNGALDSLRAIANARSIYYLQDQDSAYVGVNDATSDIIDFYQHRAEGEAIVMRNAVEATLWPIRQKTPQEMRIPGFKWLENRRPKTKFELFE